MRHEYLELIPHAMRRDSNLAALAVVDGKSGTLTPSEIFTLFTGNGGIHGVDFNDYTNRDRRGYTDEKQKIERGEFFTPDSLVKLLTDLLGINAYELICDPTSGIGSMFNHIPNQARCFGNEVSADNNKIARYLYPEANFTTSSITKYEPDVYFDIVLGNPPFNLPLMYEKTTQNSQMVYLKKSYDILKVGGMCLAIVPAKWLTEKDFNKGLIREIEKRFDFITQWDLKQDLFRERSYDLKFPMKVMVLVKRLPDYITKPYVHESVLPVIGYELLKEARAKQKENKTVNILRTRKLDADPVKAAFAFKMKKHLHDIKRSKHTKGHYGLMLALYEKFMNQEKPDDMTDDVWEKESLKDEDVLRQAKEILKWQHYTPPKGSKRIRATRFKSRVRLKNSSNRETFKELYDYRVAGRPLEPWEKEVLDRDKGLARLFKKKRKFYELHSESIMDVEVNESEAARLREPVFTNPRGVQFSLNNIQSMDLARILPRRYAFLAYETGTGKTVMGLSWLLEKNRVASFILGPSIAIKGTWMTFLDANKIPYTLITSIKQVRALKKEDIKGFFLITLSTLKSNNVGKTIQNKEEYQETEKPKGSAMAKLLRQKLKLIGYKHAFLYDESDESSNMKSKQTQASLTGFRKSYCKLLMTATVSRNNMNEAYPQFELYSNNGLSFICYAPQVTYPITKAGKKTGDFGLKPNPHYMKPFPARKGAAVFASAFSPRKSTVFGIMRDNQDIWQTKALYKTLDSIRLVRTFIEVAGERSQIKHHLVNWSAAGEELQEMMHQDYSRMIRHYRGSTGNTRRDAALQACQQLQLMIEGCLHPHLFDEWTGEEYCNKLHAVRDLVGTLNEPVMIGVLRKQVMNQDYLEHWCEFLRPLGRPVLVIHGGLSVKKRQQILTQVETSHNAILIATQQSLKSSVNAPDINHVIIPALQWNLPKMHQFYARCVRMDMKHDTTIHFVNYKRSLEGNLWSLLLNKERSNKVVQMSELESQDALGIKLNLDMDIVNELIGKEKDDEGNTRFVWTQTISTAAPTAA